MFVFLRVESFSVPTYKHTQEKQNSSLWKIEFFTLGNQFLKMTF